VLISRVNLLFLNVRCSFRSGVSVDVSAFVTAYCLLLVNCELL
jgi:hypothetical protein